MTPASSCPSIVPHRLMSAACNAYTHTPFSRAPRVSATHTYMLTSPPSLLNFAKELQVVKRLLYDRMLLMVIASWIKLTTFEELSLQVLGIVVDNW